MKEWIEGCLQILEKHYDESRYNYWRGYINGAYDGCLLSRDENIELNAKLEQIKNDQEQTKGRPSPDQEKIMEEQNGKNNC